MFKTEEELVRRKEEVMKRPTGPVKEEEVV